jgi:glycine/D-amino acid oxidase-like deaminating enzyme/nitrite reductase/ring-hydroxylating ferredoxin subunit
MKTTSYWLKSARLSQFTALSRNLTVDVVIIGGGITGITAAYLFKKAGCSVALLDRGHCGGVDTAYTTAHLTAVTDKRLHELQADFGKDNAQAVWHAGLAALDQIAANVRAENIDCEFSWVPGYLHVAPHGDSDIEEEAVSLEKDIEVAQELGFSVEFVKSVPYFKRPGIKFANQAKFHPLKYLAALVDTIPGQGSHIFENTEATEFSENPLEVHADKYKLRCSYVVLATHTPLMGKTGMLSATLLQTKLSLYTSYVIGAEIPKGLIPEACFWDTDDPYHYLRIDSRSGVDFAIFGGEDQKTGQEGNAESVYRRLEQTLQKTVPEANPVQRWSGQVIETNDGLPFIGETARQQFAATGFAGNGMTFGTLGAMMAVDAYLQRKNPWSRLFDVNRKKLTGAWDYLRENKDYPYYLLRDWLAGAEANSWDQLKRNQGMIISLDGKKVAAYRDARGKVSLCSPVCTHLKCIVAWNNAEKTWDCPCHGSRFKPTGEVLAGPAEEDLEKLPTPVQQEAK